MGGLSHHRIAGGQRRSSYRLPADTPQFWVDNICVHDDHLIVSAASRHLKERNQQFGTRHPYFLQDAVGLV
jgi:hypothetical protein